jgi:hypothetical protein
MLAQCKATEAERKMKSDHDKLVKLHDKLGHLAELRLYFLRDGQPVFVKLDETTLPGLVSEGDPWKVVTASVSLKLRDAAEHKQMISELSTKLHWGGSDAKLDAMYRAIVPFWKKLAEQKFQWSGESRVEFRKLLDQYRGYLVSQDAHVTKALMLPKFSPVEIESDESLFKRDSSLEQKIVKQAGFAMKVEKEHDYRTPIHVVRSTSNGSKLIVYHCNRSGFLSEEDVSWLTSIVTRLPKQVEFRVAWYENKRSIVTKTVKDEAGLRFFTTQRGID